MTIPSLVLDLAALAVILLCAAYYAHRGLVSAIFSFFGTLIALVLSVLASRFLAPAIFDAFFKANLEGQMTEALTAGGFSSVRALLDSVLSFLPANAITLIENNLEISLDFAAPDVAAQVVEQVLRPLVVPLIAIIAFFVLFSLVRALVGVIRSLAVGLQKVPAMNTVNTALGAVAGVFIAVLYIYLAMCVVWAYDALTPQNPQGSLYLSHSIVYRLFGHFNFFTKI